MIDGRRHDIGLGPFPLVTLAEARDAAFENRRLVRRGGDPLADKRKPGVPTFRDAARQSIEANRPRWRTDRTARDRMRSMGNRVFPVIGDMRVDRIRRGDVLRVLMPIWPDRPDVARRLRRRIRATLEWKEWDGMSEVVAERRPGERSRKAWVGRA